MLFRLLLSVWLLRLTRSSSLSSLVGDPAMRVALVLREPFGVTPWTPPSGRRWSLAGFAAPARARSARRQIATLGHDAAGARTADLTASETRD